MPTQSPPSARLAPTAALLTVLLLAVAGTTGCGDSSDMGSGADVGPDTGDGAGPADTPSAGDSGPGAGCVSDDECVARIEATACEVPRCAGGECVLSAVADLTPCDDANACTLATTCIGGACSQGSPLACNDGNPCTKDSCEPVTGCTFTGRDEGACDDGDPCSTNDTCTAGVCSGLPVAECACAADEDCDVHEDASLCNGVMFCEGGQCRLDASTVVDCPAAPTCRISTCKPSSGTCGMQLAPNGTDCDDGNPCTSEDRCSEGVCVGESGACECLDDADCAIFQLETFDLCQGPLVCVAGSCEPDSDQAVVCEDDTAEPCITTACDPATGLCVTLAVAEGSSCPASDACAPPGTCHLGKCQGAAPDCDDDDDCTADVCVDGVGCEHLPNEGPCDDGDACSANDVCVEGQCTPGHSVVCDDLNPCTADMCIAGEVGCTAQPLEDGTGCASSDACLTDGICAAGACVDQVPVSCEDPGPCATSSCVAGEGCVVKPAPDGQACEDGNACTQEGTCAGGKCVTLPLPCSDGNPCTVDGCSAGGCVYEFAPAGVACQPGDPCLEGGTCSEGECVGGEPLACPDGLCDVRECDSETGTCEIVHLKPEGTECGGANACATPGACQDGSCAGVGTVDCDDGDNCTVDSCEPEFGNCKHAPAVCAPDLSQPCAAPVCDAVTGCGLEPDPVCEAATVVWATGLPCETAEWTATAPTDTPGFAVESAPPPAGNLSDDCHLRVHVPADAAATETPWTTTISGPPKTLPAESTQVRVRLWSYWQWGGVNAWQHVERRVQLLAADGVVLGAAALDGEPTTADGWLPQEVVLALESPPPAQVRVGFALTSTPSEAPGSNTWWVDAVVLLAE